LAGRHRGVDLAGQAGHFSELQRILVGDRLLT
jgi:hypothetical protein